MAEYFNYVIQNQGKSNYLKAIDAINQPLYTLLRGKKVQVLKDKTTHQLFKNDSLSKFLAVLQIIVSFFILIVTVPMKLLSKEHKSLMGRVKDIHKKKIQQFKIAKKIKAKAQKKVRIRALTQKYIQKLKDKVRSRMTPNLLKNKKIAVLTRGLNGYGDYACARKICLHLHEKMGIKKENIAFATCRSGMFGEELTKRGFSVIQDDFQSLRKWGVDFQIIAPVTDDWYVRNKVCLKDIPTLAIAEYGFKRPAYLDVFPNVHSYAFGFTPDSMGVFLNEELLNFREASAEKRIDQLKNIPEPLQNAILGQNYSEEAVRNFAKTSHLYFGYSHNMSEMRSFIKAVVKMNQEIHDRSDLCFYFMGQDFDWKHRNISDEDLIAQGIGSIEYLDLDAPKLSQKMVFGVGKNLKIISAKLNPKYVNDLHKASEFETLGTGDQTFSEELAQGKAQAYELFRHKKELYEQYVAAFPEDMRKEIDFHVDNLINEEKLAQFYIRRRLDPAFAKRVDEAIEHIHETYDFSPRFEKAVNKLLQGTQGLKKEKPKEITLTANPKSEEIPFEKLILLSVKDICKLRIIDGVSEMPEFENSFFKAEEVRIGEETYFATFRYKKGDPEIVALSENPKSNEIPYNTTVLLSGEDMDKMKIRVGDRQSETLEFNDSIFEYERVSKDNKKYYATTRHKIKPPLKIFLTKDPKSNEIPKYYPVILSIDDVIKLKIRRGGKSDLPEFQDSFFDSKQMEMGGDMFYCVTRFKG